MVGVVPVGCGQCLPCRINRRRIWSWRMFLESLCHEASSFITLTYSDEFLPIGGSLEPRQSMLWLKRLRKALAPRRVRFFLCGEYGDQTNRPHYHACLFGVGFQDWSMVSTTWGKGFVHTGDFNQTTAQYVCGYVTKKMTSPDDPRLNGRYPEFARMSNRPGIGAAAMEILSDQLHSIHGLDEIRALGDVPKALKMGRSTVPLGRYLRSRLRVEMGFTDAMVQEVKGRFFSEKSQEMFRVFTDTAVPRSLSLSQALAAENQGKIWSIEGKARIKHRRVL